MKGVGAYGFVLNGLGAADEWLNPAPDSWVGVEVAQGPGRDIDRTRVTEESAEIVVPGGRGIVIRREPASIRFHGDEDLPAPLIVHPFLAPAASVLAHWQGWVPLHAGAFSVDDAAWLVLGERGAGKSSTLAALSDSGIPVLTDDLAILRDNNVLAGPRSVDLRDGRSYGSVDLGLVGERNRWRVGLAQVPSETPVVGAIQLEWSDRPEVRRLNAGERSGALAAALSMSVDAQAFLRTLAIPVFELSRPRGNIIETINLVRAATSQ